jgi:hypothetical protein
MFEGLFEIDERWSFRLGPRCFDLENCEKNIFCVKEIIDIADKNNLKYVFTGSLSLILNYGKTYRNPDDIDLLVEKKDVFKWINLLMSNYDWCLSEEKQIDGLSFEQLIDFSIKNQEKFASLNKDKCSSETNSATIYSYENNLFKIQEHDSPINNYHTNKNPHILIHNPNKADELSMDENFFQIHLKSPSFLCPSSHCGFIYYTNDFSDPFGKEGIPEGSTKVMKLSFEKTKNKNCYWVTDKIDKNILNNLKYKISIFEQGVLYLKHKTTGVELDLIVDYPERMAEKNYTYKNIGNTKIFYDKAEFLWARKKDYNRTKDINDIKYFKKILPNSQ